MTHVILAVSYRAEMLEKEIEAKEQEVRYASNYIKLHQKINNFNFIASRKRMF